MKKYDSMQAFLQDLPGLASNNREKLRGQSGLFELETKQGMRLWVRMEDGAITLPETTPAEKPDCTVTADEKDLLAMINGELSPVKAILFGKVKVKGNKGLLMKLAALMG